MKQNQNNSNNFIYQEVTDIELASQPSQEKDGSSDLLSYNPKIEIQEQTFIERVKGKIRSIKQFCHTLQTAYRERELMKTIKQECILKNLTLLKQKITKKNILSVIILIILFSLQVLSKYLYVKTVDTPEDLDWLTSHMKYMSEVVLLCVVINIICFYTAWARAKSIIILLLQILYTFLFTTENVGWSLKHHGGFNALIFYFVMILLLIVINFIYLLYKLFQKNKYYKALVISIILLILLTIGMIIHKIQYARVVWPIGVQNQRLINSEEYCRINTPKRLYIDMLDGYQDFWVNFLPKDPDCQSRSPKFAVEFDKSQQIINIKCPSDEVTIDILPLIETWNSQERGNKISQDLAKNIISNTITKEVQMINGVGTFSASELVNESFRLWCNGDSRLLNRVVKRQLKSQISQPQGLPSYNILTIYIDAFSRRHFMRKFAKTQKLFNDKDELDRMGIELFQFFRYHSSDYHTYFNALALYTGQTYELDVNRYNLNYDTMPMLHEYYQKHGWVTVRVDGQCQNEPEEFFSRQSSWDHEFIGPICDGRFHDVDPEKTFNNFHGPYGSRDRCIDGQKIHQILFDYYRKFKDHSEELYPNKNWYIYITLMEGHEGTGEVIEGVDVDLYDLLVNDIDYDNTIVIIDSDHGLHMGLCWAFQTEDIITENRLPLLDFLIPKRLLELRPEWKENLLYNQQTLISHFDLRQTMVQLIEEMRNVTEIEPTEVQKGLEHTKLLDYKTGKFKDHRYWIKGESILKPLKRDRTCTEIGIKEDFCVCK